MKIKIETLEDITIEGELITFIDLNKIARNTCKGLTYLMNIMDINSSKNTTYMWFKNDDTNTNYLVEI